MASGKVVQDPVTGEMVVYDAQGNEVSRYDPTTAFAELSGSAPSGGSTMIDKNGKAIPATSAPAAPTGAPQQALPTTTSPDTGTSYDTSTNYGRSYNQRSSGRSSTAWYDNTAYSDPFAGMPGSFGGNPPPVPTYADGSMHPSQGGQPRVPGGMWNSQPDDGYDNRQQVRVPGGATAGPFEVSAAPNAHSDYYAGGSSGGGGGGGSNMGANSALGQQMRAKVEGMAAKITGGGGSSYSSTDSTQQYRRDGRRMDKAYEKYNEALGDPNPMPVRGWVKEQGFKPGQVSAFVDDPALLLSSVFGDQTNETMQPLIDMPMTDLALMTAGTQGRGLMSKTPVVKVPGILRQNGVKPVKPDYKRSLDPSKVANRIAEMYGGIGAGNQRFDTDALLGNLSDASKNSAVRQGLRQQFEFDPGGAVDQMENYIQSAYAAGGASTLTRGESDAIHRQFLTQAPTALRMKGKRADRAIQSIANSFA